MQRDLPLSHGFLNLRLVRLEARESAACVDVKGSVKGEGNILGVMKTTGNNLVALKVGKEGSGT